MDRKHAGYREPADLPIEVALTDPLDGCFLYGDDNVDYDPLRIHRDLVGPDRSGAPAKSDKKKKDAAIYKRADQKLDLQTASQQILQQDPRYQGIRTKKHRNAIALLAAGLQLGLPYLKVSDLLFGDFEPLLPDEVEAYGFPDVAAYMTGQATTATPPLAPQQREQQLDQGLKQWGPIKSKIEQISAVLGPLMKEETQLRGQIAGIWQDVETKTRMVDDVLYKFNTFPRDNVSYKGAIDKLRELLDVSLHPLVDACIAEFTTPSRVDTITMKGKVPPKVTISRRSKLADDLANRRIVNRLKQIDKVLSEILSVAQASGLTEGLQRAASRLRRQDRDLFAFAEVDWMDGVEQHADKVEAARKQADQRWVTMFTPTTCDICTSRDGQVFPEGTAPECPAHPNCRCQLVQANRQPFCQRCGGRRVQAEMGITPATPTTPPAMGTSAPGETMGGFKEGDQVQDGAGRNGIASVGPDGSLSVQFDDGGKSTFDQQSVNGGAVKRAGLRKLRRSR